MTTKISSDNIQASTLATIGSGPKVSQIQVCDSSYNVLDDTAVDIAGGYIKITGTGFKTGATVTVNRQQATSVTFVSSTELRAQVAAETAGTYVVYVVNTDGSVALRVNGVTFSALPTWTTASTLPPGDSGTAISIQLVAAEATTYSVAAGSTLPSGITLSSGGLLSGTINVNDETLYNFSVVATDAQLQDSPRSFSITITVGDPLFAQTTLLLPGSASTFVSDSSTNNLAITVAGDTKPSNFSPYLSQYSTQFNAKTNYVSVPATTALTTFAGDFTFEAWIYPTDTAIPYWKIWDSRQNGATAQAMVLGLDPRSPAVTGQGRLSYFNGSSYYGTGVVQYNRWTHIAFVRSGTTLTFYVDGVAGGTATVSGTQTGTATTNPIWIGTKDNGSASYGTTGHISDLRVVNGTAVYASNFTPPTERLTAITNTVLLTCQDNRYKDNSANNYTLTPSGTSISAFSPFAETASANGSGYFDGTGDWLTVPYSSAFSLGTTYTIEAWVYPTVLSAANHEIFNILNPTVANFGGCIFYVNASGVLYFETRPGTGGTNIALNGGTVRLNAWTHVCVSVSSGAAKLFVNGTQVDFDTVAALNGTQSHVAIGAFTNGFTAYPWFGYISNLRVVKDTALYTANFTPPTQPLTAVSGTSLLTLQNSVSHTNSQFVDSSSNNLLVTRAGNATQGSFSPYSPSGWSNYFDGTGDYLSVADNTALQLGSGNFTVEFWVNFSSIAGYATLWDKGYNNAGGIFLQTGNGNGRLIVYASGSAVITETGTGTTGTWIHYALVRNGTTLTLYRDGISTGTATNSTNFNSSALMGIGVNVTGTPLSYLTGYISNLRIVKGTAVYTANFTPSTQPLTAVAGTTLLTCCDNRFIDESPNNFAITRAGGVRVANFSPHKAVAQTPRSYSTYFDGTGDLVQLASSSAFNLGEGDFTIEMWVNLDVTNIQGQYFFQSTGFNPNMFLWNNGVIYLRTSETTGDIITPTASGIVAGVWTHVACVRSGNTYRIYINGNLLATGTSTAVTSANSELFFGKNVKGYISNYRLVKGTAVYTANFTPPTQPLTAIANTSLLTCQSPIFTDNSTNRFALTVSGNPRPATVNPFGTTFVNSTGYIAAEYSGSAYFDGTGDYLDLPNNSIFSQVGAWTLELWVYPTVAQNNYVYSQVTTNFLQININASMVVNIDRSGVGNSITSTNPIPLSAWTHLALVSDGTNMRLFINGTQSGSTAAVGTQAISATTTRIGAYQSNGTLGFAGYISDLRLVKGQAVYTANFVAPVAPVQPVHSTALTLKSTSAGIVDATTKNDVETIGDVRVSSAVSKFGGSSMYFDGTGDCLAMPTSVNFAFPNNSSWTVETWINSSSYSTYRCIFSNRSGGTGIALYVGSGAEGSGLVFASNTAVFAAGGTLSNNVWHHIAYVRDNNTVRAYLDGVLVVTATDSRTYAASTSATIGAADTSGTQPFLGYMQDFRVTKGIARYTANFTPPTSAFNIK